MFITLDTVRPKAKSNAVTSISLARVCDQCRKRKVRCDMTQPCAICTRNRFTCTYDEARKKRGPRGKIIEDIRRHQRSDSQSNPGSASSIDSTVMDTLINETFIGHPSSDTRATETSQQQRIANQSSPESSSWPARNSFIPSAAPPEQSATEPPVANDIDLSSHAGILHTTNSADDRLGGDDFNSIQSPHASEFIFPSLPVESPSSAVFDAFGSIPQQDLPPLEEATDIWPLNVNEQTLLPWIDVYFKRLHPTIPILSRANLYCDMLSHKHRYDAQYGSMLLGLCAFAMEQPVQIHERAMKATRSEQSRMLLHECAKMRVAANFGEDPTIEMILTSFFMFACLFGVDEHRAARHRLREAIDLAHSLGLHLPQSYQALTAPVREQWLRTYLVLSVTERAYALQQSHSISFRGRPGITARFMQDFDPSMTGEYLSDLLHPEDPHADAVSMTALLYLMDTFDAIDESLMDCWNGFCRTSDGVCDSFDRRRACQMFRAQHRVRDECLSGNLSFAPTITPLSLRQLLASQQVDISVTQMWLLNRLWQLCFTHGLLRETSEHCELQLDFACQIAQALLEVCNKFSMATMEVHGLGMMMKVYDVALGVITAVQASTTLNAQSIIIHNAGGVVSHLSKEWTEISVRGLLEGFARLMNNFRGGDHKYATMLAGSTASVMGFT